MIEVRNLTFRYVGRREPTLRDVSFSCVPGEVLLVLGPSGCGKSTLALCLNGGIPHSISGAMSGQVLIDGVESQERSMAVLAQHVGLMFQDPEAQFCMPRVADEVAFGLENLAVPPAEMDARIDVALAQVGLGDRRAERIERLSGGQKQRLALACVLAQGPEVLVFDEPTAQLDPQGAEEFVGVLGRLRATRRHTIVLVEHRLDDIMHLVDRCAVLSADGRLDALGPPRAVLAQHGARLLEAGVWAPQVTELGLRLGTPSLPLTVGQAADVFRGKLTVTPRGGLHPSPLPNGEGTGLAVSNLTYRYPGAERPVLDDISVRLQPGEFVALVGPNGAGKSTLARLIARIIRAPKGTVVAQERVGYVFQYPEHQFVAATAVEDVAYGPRRHGLAHTAARELAFDALAELGLAGLAEAHPFSLSLGEQRRLSVADMLVLQPAVLILDEPTFGQDRASAARLSDKMAALALAGSTVLAITHDVKLVAGAPRVLALAGGRLIFDGSPRALFGDEQIMQRAGLAPPPVWQLSDRLGLQPPALEVDELGLSDVGRKHDVVRLARS